MQAAGGRVLCLAGLRVYWHYVPLLSAGGDGSRFHSLLANGGGVLLLHFTIPSPSPSLKLDTRRQRRIEERNKKGGFFF